MNPINPNNLSSEIGRRYRLLTPDYKQYADEQHSNGVARTALDNLIQNVYIAQLRQLPPDSPPQAVAVAAPPPTPTPTYLNPIHPDINDETDVIELDENGHRFSTGFLLGRLLLKSGVSLANRALSTVDRHLEGSRRHQRDIVALLPHDQRIRYAQPVPPIATALESAGTAIGGPVFGAVGNVLGHVYQGIRDRITPRTTPDPSPAPRRVQRRVVRQQHRVPNAQAVARGVRGHVDEQIPPVAPVPSVAPVAPVIDIGSAAHAARQRQRNRRQRNNSDSDDDNNSDTNRRVTRGRQLGRGKKKKTINKK